MNNMTDSDPNSKLSSFNYLLSKEPTDICSMRIAYYFHKLTKYDDKVSKNIHKLTCWEYTWTYHATCFNQGPEYRLNFCTL